MVALDETFLHYLWFGKHLQVHQQTTDGRTVEIIDAGIPNTNAGPDVFNAKVRIGDTVWAGNVEFHRVASDWLRHGHQKDRAYQSVVLHVVLEADTEIYRTDGHKIPQMVPTYTPEVVTAYKQAEQGNGFIRCAGHWPQLTDVILYTWLERLLVERLETKIAQIDRLLQQTINNWEESFYIILTRSFGCSTNSDAFEELAKSLPQHILAKHKDNLLQLEALLLGQAGFLEYPKDDYSALLAQEYAFLKKKYTLQPLHYAQFKLLRLRPNNFPTVRIAQLAALIHRSSNLFSKTIDTNTIQQLPNLFACTPSTYWETHFVLGETSPKRSKCLSKTFSNILIINTVVPFLFAYGRHHDNDALTDAAMQLLRTLPAEHNSLVKGFCTLGVQVTNAAVTQALIQLKRQYCEQKKCLQCAIGHTLHIC